jgi:hypothetical protein
MLHRQRIQHIQPHATTCKTRLYIGDKPTVCHEQVDVNRYLSGIVTIQYYLQQSTQYSTTRKEIREKKMGQELPHPEIKCVRRNAFQPLAKLHFCAQA